jgi:CRP/FNR family cyclic AMP-dependent transcriptional regulator
MRVLRDVTIDKHSALAAHPLFGQLSGEERERLVTYMRVNRCPAGTVLIRKGDPGSNMMVVMQGRVKICAHSEDGKELVFSLVKPGEVFGEIALLDGSARTADAVALDDCELLVLERRDFVPFLSRHPEACMRLFGVLCQKLRRTSEQLEQRFFLEGEARLAKQLVNLAEIFGRPVDDGIRIDLRLSQSQLGNMVGMSRESMNKQLGQWRREDLIRMDDGYITIPDLDRLREI